MVIKKTIFWGFKSEKLLVDDKILIWIISMNFYEFLNRVKHLMHSSIILTSPLFSNIFVCYRIREISFLIVEINPILWGTKINFVPRMLEWTSEGKQNVSCEEGNIELLQHTGWKTELIFLKNLCKMKTPKKVGILLDDFSSRLLTQKQGKHQDDFLKWLLSISLQLPSW